MRVLELFAGAGGAALGLERAGLHHAALCEWDANACATLRAAGLGPVVEGDVRDLDRIEAAAGAVDVLWSSFPCQAWSTAGKRRGAQDERNGWPWTVDAIDRFRPAWFLGENVRGLLLHAGGCAFAGGQAGLFAQADPTACPGCYFERVIVPDLRRRFACVGWWLLDAADYGVPQHRRRVILWAGPRPLTRPAPTHGPGRAQAWVSMGEALGLGAGIAEYGRGRSGRRSYESIPLDGPANAVGCGGSSGVAMVTEWVPVVTGAWEDGRPPLPVEGPAPTLTIRSCEATPWTSAGGLYLYASGVTGCGAPRSMDHTAPTIGTKGNAYLAHPSPTVSAVGEEKGSGPGGHSERMQRASDALYLGTGRRRLTVAECACLQDFPADHPFQGGVSAQYRQVGNAVPPRLAEVVGRALLQSAQTTPRPR